MIGCVFAFVSKIYRKVKMNVFVYKWTPRYKDVVDKQNGRCVKSPIFHTLSNDSCMYWRIELYPNGRRPLCTNRCSIFLHLVGSNTSYDTISAKFQFELVTAPSIENNNYRTPLSEQYDFKKNQVNDTSLCFDRFAPNLASIPPNQLFMLGERILIKCTIELAREAFKRSIRHNDLNSKTDKFMFCQCSFIVLISQKYDVILASKDNQKFYCHRSVLSKQSSVLKHIFDSDALRLDTREIEQVLFDIDEDALREILIYIYLGTFCEKRLSKVVTQVLPFSEKHGLPALKLKCAELLLQNVSRENAVEYLILADHHKLEDVKKRAVTLIIDELKEIKDEQNWKTFLQTYPNLVQCIFDEVASHNVLAAF